jgi:hypothetical protein
MCGSCVHKTAEGDPAMTHVLLIGNGAREHAIAEAIRRSERNPRLYSFMKTNNPGIASLSEKVCLGRYDEPEAIAAFARETGVAFAIVGPEDPLRRRGRPCSIGHPGRGTNPIPGPSGNIEVLHTKPAGKIRNPRKPALPEFPIVGRYRGLLR